MRIKETSMTSTTGTCDFRRLVERYMRRHQYKSALFWADKQYSMTCSSDDPTAATDDALQLARCLLFSGHAHRAIQLLNEAGPPAAPNTPGVAQRCGNLQHKQQIRRPAQRQPRASLLRRQQREWCFLAGRCLMETGDMAAAADLLQQHSEADDEQERAADLDLDSEQPPPENETATTTAGHEDAACLKARLLVLRGQAHQALEDRQQATECYRAALHADVTCYEALDALLGHQLLSADEERQLLQQLPFSQQLHDSSAAGHGLQTVVRALYLLQLKKYAGPPVVSTAAASTTTGSVVTPTVGPAAANCSTTAESQLPPQLLVNGDVMTWRAERLYYACDVAASWRVTCAVLRRDSDHPACLLVYVACLLEREDTGRLFELAHRLVERYPERALAWFSVGAYYYSVGSVEPARRYLIKATSLEPLFGPAWLLYGHCFARDNEHDQAISAYLSACQLMRGCHLPLLYAGLEYALTNNARLAQQFFEQAHVLAPRDPCQLHEMGVAAFVGGDFAQADSWFARALRVVESEGGASSSAYWEPLYNNIGHVRRKLGRLQEACEAHRHALLLCPDRPSTLAALAFTCALMEQHSEAVHLFHRALSMRRDDTFSAQMLDYVLQQMVVASTGDSKKSAGSTTACGGAQAVDALGDDDCGYCDYGLDDDKLLAEKLLVTSHTRVLGVGATGHDLTAPTAAATYQHETSDCSNEMSLDFESDRV